MEIKLTTPDECSAEEISSFCSLVLEGEQVPGEGLTARVMTCQLLGFAYEGKELIAVTAIKNPVEQYKNGVFRKAGVAELSKEFPFEVGYAFTKPAFRGRGIHPQIVAALIKAGAQPIFTGQRKQPMYHISWKK